MFLASYHSRAGPEAGSGRVTNVGGHDKTLSTRAHVSKGNKTLGRQGGNK